MRIRVWNYHHSKEHMNANEEAAMSSGKIPCVLQLMEQISYK